MAKQQNQNPAKPSSAEEPNASSSPNLQNISNEHINKVIEHHDKKLNSLHELAIRSIESRNQYNEMQHKEKMAEVERDKIKENNTNYIRKIIIICLTTIVSIAILGGTFLIYSGYSNEGKELITLLGTLLGIGYGAYKAGQSKKID